MVRTSTTFPFLLPVSNTCKGKRLTLRVSCCTGGGSSIIATTFTSFSMTSSCARLCLRCRRFLSSKTLTPVVQYSTQVYNRSLVTSEIKNELFGGNMKTQQARQSLRQQTFHYCDIKHLVTGSNEKRLAVELSTADIVPCKNPLMPVNEREVQSDPDAVAEPSALRELTEEEALSITVPAALPPASTSLRDYVDKSETLNKLVQLGVDLWKLEQRPNVGTMLLKLDFDTDVAPRLLFLKDNGVEESRFGYILTHNPFILTEDLENLHARVNYLLSKKFSSEEVASMVSKAPYLLNFSVKRLDNRLGFYQQQLKLSAVNTRNIVARLPRLLCRSLEPVKENLKVCEIELGFKKNEIQHIVLTIPKVLTANKKRLIQIFNFLHNTMNVPHHLITKFPQVLNSKFLRIRERHMFLKYLGRDQYDPDLPNYIALDRLVSLPDEAFCSELASTTLEDFYLFQKTL
ncbi:transcription termination factor 3, mitochondrial [Cynoglossus semilaevis]|uniref:Transcription termination factor 3, mitochondrial n=1 Tax=Cynoglossus semilaevis TaxID=244447 RepID=A0A3P8WKM2_CYNSE|nr:transcription termination factor 3, mitochondrial [Cynoglossus semilaevis]